MPDIAGGPADHPDVIPDSGVDSEREVTRTVTGPTLPPHLRPDYLGMVAAGGAVGAVSRYLITNAVAPALSQPAVTMIINLVGSLLLGVLLEELAFRGPDVGVRRRLRLVLGTGVLGGFTTYSTLALDTATFLDHGRLWAALGYGLGSVTLGAAAAAAGVWLAMATHRRRQPTGARR